MESSFIACLLFVYVFLYLFVAGLFSSIGRQIYKTECEKSENFRCGLEVCSAFWLFTFPFLAAVGLTKLFTKTKTKKVYSREFCDSCKKEINNRPFG